MAFRKTGIFKFYFFIILMLLLASCSTSHRRYKYGQDFAPNFKVNPDDVQNPVPRAEPLSKHGNPSSYVVLGKRYYVLKSAKGYDQTGIASWYGMKFHDHKTSNGEEYDVAKMTGASKVLPLPTYVQVTNLKTGKKIIVRINDRGPFCENRIIDLSYVAAAKLGMLPTGTALVEVKAIDANNPEETESAPPIVPIGRGQIYVQIGAFAVESNATRLQSKIESLTNYPVIIQTGDLNGAPLYRVQIGPIPNVDSTDSLHHTLLSMGLGEPMTVIK
ncbi:MAG TPA: septal ring lytic transglycosylase RlpA family protein [Gammaproteobacteria bacterium]|nr:septal ring lytic transglycosylase RlpA family protein [Gammaproteobacteria bacterium]